MVATVVAVAAVGVAAVMAVERNFAVGTVQIDCTLLGEEIAGFD